MMNFTGLPDVWINSHEMPSADLTVEVEMIDVTPLAKIEPDMLWTYVDYRGHFHAFTHDGSLPTLLADKIAHEHEEDGEIESWDETIMRCRICREVVEPRYREHMPIWREQAPGRKSWTVDVRWPSEILLPTPGELVSVRIKITPREYFGVGLVTNRVPGYGPDGMIADVTIIGRGDLGHRKVT